MVKNPLASAEDFIRDSRFYLWVRKTIPWRRAWQPYTTEEPGRLQLVGSQRVGYD